MIHFTKKQSSSSFLFLFFSLIFVIYFPQQICSLSSSSSLNRNRALPSPHPDAFHHHQSSSTSSSTHRTSFSSFPPLPSRKSEPSSKKINKPLRWIIHLLPNCTHQHFRSHLDYHLLHHTLTPLSSFSSSSSSSSPSLPQIIHQYERVIHGLALQNIHENDVKQLPCIKSYAPDSIKRLVSVPSWGIDRIDQKNLPLDDKYESSYTGRDVDVYILDTGLDANHVEFSAGTHPREVKNIYNAFISNPLAPETDTDGHGHGTHVAGTIGGKTVGVAKAVNIYALKILSDEGEGDTSDILHGLDVVHARGSTSGHRSIMSMSLGGECEGECSSDSLVMAIESLYTAGIISSVASGNSGCNGCFGSPNAAPHAINVGASNIADEITFFSNYGPCVDIFAPGYNIISSSPKSVSHSESQYVAMSGTSMACPHVTGTLALTMEKYPQAPLADIVKSLICDAAESLLNINPYDTTSRNLLLQVPKNGVHGIEHCPHTYTCSTECLNGGICLPSRVLTLPNELLSPLVQIPVALNSTQCYCEAGYSGTSCESITSTLLSPSCDRSSHKVTINLLDSFGDGWSFGRFLITNFEGRTLYGATDSLCEGSESSRTYCLPEGKYILAVDKGMFPQENEWNMCGISGGAQYTGVFSVESKSHGSVYCKFICEGGARPMDSILMMSEDDGWAGAFYSVYSQSGVMLYGGTLLEGTAGAHHVCFPKSECSIMLIRLDGEAPADISYEVCGYTALPTEILKICVDEIGRCTAEPQEPLEQSTCPSNAHPSITNHLPISLMNFALKKYPHATSNSIILKISDTSNHLLSTTTSTNQFLNTFDLCLTNGCYNLEITGAISPQESGYHSSGLWVMCGHKGTLPLQSTFCLDHDYNFCYGLGGCPTLVSYAHSSERQYFVLYGEDENGEGDLVDMIADVGTIHGVYEICDLPDGVYHGYFGVGKSYSHNEAIICQQTIQIPSEAHVRITGNGTTCHLTNINVRTCPANHFPHDILKVDEYGDGWGKHALYTIHEATGTKPIIATGKLSSGQVGVDHLCLEKHKCYTITVTDTSDYSDEILWVMCGYVGDVPTQNLEFCTEENSCYFTSVSEDSYNKIDDDDFPFISSEPSAIPTEFYAISPSTSPSSLPSQQLQSDNVVPSSLPSLAPSSSPSFSSASSSSSSPSLNPTIIPSTVVSTQIPTNSPTLPPSLPELSSSSPTFVPSSTPSLSPTQDISNPPTNFPSTHADDDDNVYDQPYQGINSVYLMTIDVNISFHLTINTTSNRQYLDHSDLQFLEFALRKLLDLHFITWNSSYTNPSLSHSSQQQNVYFGHLICTFLVRIPSEDFDFFTIKQSLVVSLQTDYFSGKLQKIVTTSLLYQASESGGSSSESQYPLSSFLITFVHILPGTAQILSFSSSHPEPYSTLFLGLNLTKLLLSGGEGPEEATLSPSSNYSSSEYWDSHAWFALTVSGFTLASMLLCYLIFLFFRCRIKRMDPSLLSSTLKVSNQRKGYAKVNIGQNDSSHNNNNNNDSMTVNINTQEEGGEGSGRSGKGQGKGIKTPSTEIAKRVGQKIMKGVKDGLRRGRQGGARDVEDGSGFVELDNLDSEEEITLDLNEMVATHQQKKGWQGDRGGGGGRGGGREEEHDDMRDIY